MTGLPVIDLLTDKGFIDSRRARLFGRCRDAQVDVFIDQASGVIYVDPGFTGRDAAYYEEKDVPSHAYPRNDMDWADTRRRSAYLAPLVAGRRWVDFGCGPGYQLRKTARLACAHLGVELNRRNIDLLTADGFSVTPSLDDVSAFRPDVVSLFHVLEHLADPVGILSSLARAAGAGAWLLVEVPHAGDSLLHAEKTDFRNFTLWSEHVVLHTRSSLRTVIEEAGWAVEEMIGVQRYPVWNHLHWLDRGRPSGLKASAGDDISADLHRVYAAHLASRDATDTLLAMAKLK